MRKTSHGESPEPYLEYLLSDLRFNKAAKFIKYGSKVADLGCGFNGNFLRKISNIIKFGIGYDVSVNNKDLPKNISLKRIDLNKKTPKNNYFDQVVALAVLEHVENPDGFLQFAHKLLKRGGIFIITTPHKRSKTLLEFLSTVLGLISRQEINDHKNYFDESRLKSLFYKNRFKIINLGVFEVGLNLYCVAKKI